MNNKGINQDGIMSLNDIDREIWPKNMKSKYLNSEISKDNESN